VDVVGWDVHDDDPLLAAASPSSSSLVSSQLPSAESEELVASKGGCCTLFPGAWSESKNTSYSNESCSSTKSSSSTSDGGSGGGSGGGGSGGGSTDMGRHIGKRVSVFWQDEDDWYEGTVAAVVEDMQALQVPCYMPVKLGPRPGGACFEFSFVLRSPPHA
jgi:hypothetical protein